MPTTIKIQGIDCPTPDIPARVEGYKKVVKEQYFRRQEMPSYMNDVRFDTRNNPIWTPQQESFILQELDKCREGVWVMIKGVATWLPGVYYYWLTYWTLEDGTRPEYRECDRLFFIFFISCYKIPLIAGIIRGKARREGATSHGFCIELWIATNAAGWGGNKSIGNISKTGEDIDSLFENSLVYAYKALPLFLRPRQSGGTDPKNGLNFKEEGSKKQDQTRVDTSRQGLNSVITKRDTTLNAYDSGRWSFLLIDETGKWLRVNFGKYWRIVKDTLVKGAQRVGFAYMPSTVNPPKQGGAAFKRIWDAADQYSYPLNRLPQQLVRFFKPAYDGLAGFIDKYGDSVIDPPDAETLAFLIQKNQLNPNAEERVPDEYLCLGAKKYLEQQLEKLTDEDDKAEEKRKYPTREQDMFDFGDSISPFNLEKIKSQIDVLKKMERDKTNPLRRGRFLPMEYTASGEKKFNVQFVDDTHGEWLIKEFPEQANQFRIDDRGRVWPMNSHNFSGGADTFRFDKTKELGSKGVILIGSKLDPSKDAAEEGGAPAALFVGRPRLTELFWKEMLLASLYFGCSITVERDATQEYIKYFNNTMPNLLNANCLPMLGKKPDTAVDPNRKLRESDKAVEYGVSSADSFVFAKQIELAQVYIENYWWKIMFISILEDLERFDPSDRTTSDISIAFMMWLLNYMGDFRQRTKERRKFDIVRSYEVVKSAWN